MGTREKGTEGARMVTNGEGLNQSHTGNPWKEKMGMGSYGDGGLVGWGGVCSSVSKACLPSMCEIPGFIPSTTERKITGT